MNSKITALIFALLLCMQMSGQNLQGAAGFPDRSPSLDVLPGFENPPKGYGEVSFYWWIGDTLTKERLLSRLDQLEFWQSVHFPKQVNGLTGMPFIFRLS